MKVGVVGCGTADGNAPGAVDRTGPDWLVEHDSHGELIFAVAVLHDEVTVRACPLDVVPRYRSER